jgi:uncharacterized integral membrane protein
MRVALFVLAWLLLAGLVLTYTMAIEVSAFYHPNPAQARLAFGLTGWFVAGCLLVPLVAGIAALRARSHQRRLAVGGLAGGVTVFAAWMAALSWEVGHRETYWLGDRPHAIDWRWSPRNGSPVPGGEYFVFELRWPGPWPSYLPPDAPPRASLSDEIVVQVRAATEADRQGPPVRFEVNRSGGNLMEGQWVLRTGDAMASVWVEVRSDPPFSSEAETAAFHAALTSLIDGFAEAAEDVTP